MDGGARHFGAALAGVVKPALLTGSCWQPFLVSLSFALSDEKIFIRDTSLVIGIDLRSCFSYSLPCTALGEVLGSVGDGARLGMAWCML